MTPFQGELHVDADERWRRAQKAADDFEPFRRYDPILVGLAAALVALINLAIFLGVAGLYVVQYWIAAFVSIGAAFLGGFFITKFRNRSAEKAYVAEYRRLNKADQKDRLPGAT